MRVMIPADRPAVVVVTGTAGVGKTALAVRCAHRVVDRFPDGQLHLNLRGFHERQEALGTEEALSDLLSGLIVLS
ncbi:hypothetical protein ABTX15_32545 [Micromonospora sp. NPDC094482]|uniref:hypothetical protein n=1 Tax=unclassified Micromonospora TaxID=2617518 RepID=UPI00332B3229